MQVVWGNGWIKWNVERIKLKIKKRQNSNVKILRRKMDSGFQQCEVQPAEKICWNDSELQERTSRRTKKAGGEGYRAGPTGKTTKRRKYAIKEAILRLSEEASATKCSKSNERTREKVDGGVV